MRHTQFCLCRYLAGSTNFGEAITNKSFPSPMVPLVKRVESNSKVALGGGSKVMLPAPQNMMNKSNNIFKMSILFRGWFVPDVLY